MIAVIDKRNGRCAYQRMVRYPGGNAPGGTDPSISLMVLEWLFLVRPVTAEIDYRQPNHGLFIGYAPSDAPQYAVAVRIANGYSSGNACTTANDIIEYIFDLAEEEEILTGYASTDVSNTSND